MGIILITNLIHKSCFVISLLCASTCFDHCSAHHQEVKIILYSIWYRHTCRWWPFLAQVERRLTQYNLNN